MPSYWQFSFVDALIALDAAEAPHGLYGMRQARAGTSARLPTLAETLLSPKKTNLLTLLGFVDIGSRVRQDKLDFLVEPGREVELQTMDYASTKVRRFGSAHRLDTHHHKPESTPEWDLEKLVPKLGGCWRRFDRILIHAILLVAHAPTNRQLHALTGRVIEENFLRKYAVTLAFREWEDRYSRGLFSGVYLWTGRFKAQTTLGEL